MGRKKSLLSNLLERNVPDYDIENSDFVDQKSVTGLYFFFGNSYARKQADVKQVLTRNGKCIYLKYYDKDENVVVSPLIKNVMYSSSGNIVCILEDKSKLYVKAKLAKIRVVYKPKFYIESTKKQINDIREVKRLVDNHKDVRATFNEGHDTVCTVPTIVSVDIPENGSDISFSTENQKYLIFKGA